MFGRAPKPQSFPSLTAFEPEPYSCHLQAKLADLSDIVETNLAESDRAQEEHYNILKKKNTVSVLEKFWGFHS